MELVEIISGLLAIGGGPIAVAAALCTAAIRIYQTPTVEALLPEKAKFARLPSALKVALPFLLALLGSALAAVAGGAALVPALLAAIPAGLGAIGLHHGTKKLGELEAKSRHETYKPSPFRKVGTIVVPIPSPERLAKIRGK